jgi:hypothetical protein
MDFLVNDMHKLSEFYVRRCMKSQGFGKVMSKWCLHHFSDANKIGYGFASYLRLINNDNMIHCCFGMGKCRVAPIDPS